VYVCVGVFSFVAQATLVRLTRLPAVPSNNRVKLWKTVAFAGHSLAKLFLNFGVPDFSEKVSIFLLKSKSLS
jgi:hypothetical protein